MLGRSDQLHGQGLWFTFDYAEAAAPAFLRVDLCFHLFGTGDFHHLDGIEHTAVNAHLAAIAFSLVVTGLKAALSRPFFMGDIILL